MGLLEESCPSLSSSACRDGCCILEGGVVVTFAPQKFPHASYQFSWEPVVIQVTVRHFFCGSGVPPTRQSWPH